MTDEHEQSVHADTSSEALVNEAERLAGGATNGLIAARQMEMTRRLTIELRKVGGAIFDLEMTTEEGLSRNERAAKSLVEAVETLDRTTKVTANANERTARRLIWLTWGLIALTAVIAALTAALVLRGA